MRSINAKCKEHSGKILASLVTITVLALLIWAGPANALSVSLNSASNTNPDQGEIIYLTGSATFTNQKANVAKLIIDGNEYCSFDVDNGSKIQGCHGISVAVGTKNISYGYGYGDGVVNYNISIDTSFFEKGVNQIVLKINGVSSPQQSFNVNRNITPVGPENDASSAIVNSDWKISVVDGDKISSVFIPANTNITPSDPAKTMDLSKIITEITTATGMNGIQGVLQFGIPNMGLTFSQPITIEINVGNDLNGRTLSVYRSVSNESGWTQDGLVDRSCVVSSGVCKFRTNKASYFIAVLPSSTRTSGYTGGYCTTQWTCSEWSSCVDGVQTRTCVYPSNFCTPLSEKPIEQVSCVVEDMTVYDGNDTSTDNRFFNLLTGFVIGNLIENPVNMALVIVILVVIVALLWLVVSKRNAAVKKIKKKKQDKKE